MIHLFFYQHDYTNNLHYLNLLLLDVNKHESMSSICVNILKYIVKSLFFAIPIFTILIIIEAIIAHYRNIPINRSEDVISSLSSGLTNIIRDGIKFSIIIISYALLVENNAILLLEKIK